MLVTLNVQGTYPHPPMILPPPARPPRPGAGGPGGIISNFSAHEKRALKSPLYSKPKTAASMAAKKVKGGPKRERKGSEAPVDSGAPSPHAGVCLALLTQTAIH